jgi:hypothetical protein
MQQILQSDPKKVLKRGYAIYYALKYPEPVKLDTLQKEVLESNKYLQFIETQNLS